VLGQRNIFTIFNVQNPETFLAALAPDAAAFDAGAEEAAQRLPAVGTESHRGRRVTGWLHETTSL
jgi:hypothetical protein